MLTPMDDERQGRSKVHVVWVSRRRPPLSFFFLPFFSSLVNFPRAAPPPTWKGWLPPDERGEATNLLWQCW